MEAGAMLWYQPLIALRKQSTSEQEMSKDESDDAQRMAPEKFERSLREVEAAAAEIVVVGDVLFRGGEPSDPALLRRYRLYMRVKAALALPVGPGRLAALQSAKVDDHRKH